MGETSKDFVAIINRTINIRPMYPYLKYNLTIETVERLVLHLQADTEKEAKEKALDIFHGYEIECDDFVLDDVRVLEAELWVENNNGNR